MSNEELVLQIQENINPVKNMEILYIQNKGFIYRIIKKYQNIDPMTDTEDLMQQAYFGLVAAVERYRPEENANFLTYSAYWITSTVKRYLEESGRILRLPTAVQQRIYQYNNLVSYFLNHFDREPAASEVCTALQISEKQYYSLLKTMNLSHTSSLDSHVGNNEEHEMCLADTITTFGDMAEDICDHVYWRQLTKDLWADAKEIINDDKDYSVLCSRYLDGCTLKEAGERIGVTTERARTRETRAIRKLRNSRKIRHYGEENGLLSRRVDTGFVKMAIRNKNKFIDDLTKEELRFAKVNGLY